MKQLFVLCFLIYINSFFGQETFRTYSWEKLPETYNPDTIYGIRLSRLKLIEVPAELVKFKNLKLLDLSHNKLSHLPNFISDLKALETISLGKNKFTEFDSVICQITTLKSLILNRNQISQIPSCINSLKNLVVLDLWDNPIEKLPIELKELQKLKELHLEGIQFGPKFQKKWIESLPSTKIFFEQPCSCKE